MGRLVIVTGARDAGKTAALVDLAGRLAGRGLSVGGVVAVAALERGHKVSYSFRSLLTGETVLYAVSAGEAGGRRAGAGSGPGGGSSDVPVPGRGYRFLDEGLAFGCREIIAAAERRVDALVVDEVGPLEMSGAGLWPALSVAAPGFPGDLYVSVRPSLAAEVQRRLALPARETALVSPAGLARLS